MNFARLASTLLTHETTTFLFVTLPNVHRLIFFTRILSDKSFLIWFSTTSPQLKCVATLPCNLSLIACVLTLIFRKVARQRMQGVVGFLVTTLLQIYQTVFQRIPAKKKEKNGRVLTEL